MAGYKRIMKGTRGKGARPITFRPSKPAPGTIQKSPGRSRKPITLAPTPWDKK